jgi:hypothetical protein
VVSVIALDPGDGAVTAPLRCGAIAPGCGLSGVNPSCRLAFLGSNRRNAPFRYTSHRLGRRSHPERRGSLPPLCEALFVV